MSLAAFLPALLAAVSAIAPFFAVVLIGWLSARAGLFDEPGLKGLNSFIFNIALPPLLFTAMARAPIAADDWSVPWFLAVYGTATLAIYGLGHLSGRLLFGLRGGPAALHAHLAANGNAGFLGLPLGAAILGPEALVPVALALTFDILVVMTLTSAFLGGAQGGGPFKALLNPIPLSALGGALWGVISRETGADLPGPATALLELLAQAAPPAALFAVGATLAHKRGDRRVGEIGSLCLWKLAAHPAAVIAAFALAAPALAPEIPLAPVWLAGAALAAACPSSNNAVIFAVQHGVYEARASATVLISTALSLLSMAAIVALTQPGLG